jgi:hypothetical protein
MLVHLQCVWYGRSTCLCHGCAVCGPECVCAPSHAPFAPHKHRAWTSCTVAPECGCALRVPACVPAPVCVSLPACVCACVRACTCKCAWMPACLPVRVRACACPGASPGAPPPTAAPPRAPTPSPATPPAAPRPARCWAWKSRCGRFVRRPRLPQPPLWGTARRARAVHAPTHCVPRVRARLRQHCLAQRPFFWPLYRGLPACTRPPARPPAVRADDCRAIVCRRPLRVCQYGLARRAVHGLLTCVWPCRAGFGGGGVG